MIDRKDVPLFKNEPVLVLVLGFCTCGLYMIYWNLKVAEVLNKISGREVISPVIAVLSGCCMPLHVYFYYLAGQALGDLGELIGRKQELADKSTLLLVLGFFLSPVAAMIVQGHINEIYEPAR
jgi:hypothetical protein